MVRTRYAKPKPHGLMRLLLKVPPLLYRIGLARRMGPRLLVLTTTGRRTGRARTVGLNYAIDGDTVYVISGFGETDWFRNLVADHRVWVQIGTERWAGEAVPVTDPDQARQARLLFARQAGRQGPPKPIRGLIRRLGLDYEAELSVLERSELDLPVVAIRRTARR